MNERSKEDYLRVMYGLYEKLDNKSDGLRSIDISKELNITKSSVSEMLKKMLDKGYIRFKPYSNIYFTKKGLNEAISIMHNHRVIEVFLKKVLRYDLSKVHAEAHKLEHAFSEESIKRLDLFLKNPKISPHGNIIPHKDVL